MVRRGELQVWCKGHAECTLLVDGELCTRLSRHCYRQAERPWCTVTDSTHFFLLELRKGKWNGRQPAHVFPLEPSGDFGVPDTQLAVGIRNWATAYGQQLQLIRAKGAHPLYPPSGFAAPFGFAFPITFALTLAFAFASTFTLGLGSGSSLAQANQDVDTSANVNMDANVNADSGVRPMRL